MQNMPIGIFRGDDTDAFSYQTIVGTIKTDLDLTGCRAVFRYLDFSMEFDPIPEDKKITIVIPADETKKFPPGLGYASLRVYDSEDRLKTFSNRIMVFVATKTPMFGSDEFEVDFNVRATLEPLKFFVGPNPDDFDEYRGYVEKIIDRASATKYGLAILLDAIDSDLGAGDGVAATPVAVKAAYAAIIDKLTDDYYTAEQTDEAIDRVAAYYITRNADGDAFKTKAQLDSTTVFYSGGEVRVPTRNDYCVVLADETHDYAEYRYIYAVAQGETTGSWQPQFPVEGVMTVDQDVVSGSQNPVSGGGVWSAIWGALSALPTGFASLYDWCVAQLAGKASKSDATLAERGFSEWTVAATDPYYPAPYSVKWNSNNSAWDFYSGDNVFGSVYNQPQDAVEVTLTQGASAYTATRTALQGYQLGSQTDKPLASEAEAEALRTNVAGKYTKPETGIPKIDLAEGIQASLDKADTAPIVLDVARHSRITVGDVEFEVVLYWNSGARDRFFMAAQRVGTWLTQSGEWQSSAEAYTHTWKSGGVTYTATRAAGGWTTSVYINGVESPIDNIASRCAGKDLGTTAYAFYDTLNAYFATYDRDGNRISDTYVKKGNIPYDLGTPIVINTASSETVEGETVNYGAAALANRTANIVQVTAALDELRITFPAATSGKVRDFGLRVEIGTGSAALAAPALVPIAPTGETIKIENNAKEIPALADGTATAKGVTLLYFSENAPGVFVVKGEQVEEVA